MFRSGSLLRRKIKKNLQTSHLKKTVHALSFVENCMKPLPLSARSVWAKRQIWQVRATTKKKYVKAGITKTFATQGTFPAYLLRHTLWRNQKYIRTKLIMSDTTMKKTWYKTCAQNGEQWIRNVQERQSFLSINFWKTLLGLKKNTGTFSIYPSVSCEM